MKSPGERRAPRSAKDADASSKFPVSICCARFVQWRRTRPWFRAPSATIWSSTWARVPVVSLSHANNLWHVRVKPTRCDSSVNALHGQPTVCAYRKLASLRSVTAEDTVLRRKKSPYRCIEVWTVRIPIQHPGDTALTGAAATSLSDSARSSLINGRWIWVEAPDVTKRHTVGRFVQERSYTLILDQSDTRTSAKMSSPNAKTHRSTQEHLMPVPTIHPSTHPETQAFFYNKYVITYPCHTDVSTTPFVRKRKDFRTLGNT